MGRPQMRASDAREGVRRGKEDRRLCLRAVRRPGDLPRARGASRLAARMTDAGATPTVAATFLVRGIFVLGTRSLFIVRGTVTSGTVRAKQRVIGLPGMEGV